MTGNGFVQPIVAAVDGSAPALRASHWAAGMAASRRLPLRLVHAVHLPALSYSNGLGPPAGFFEVLQSDGRQVLADVEASLRASHPDLELHVELPTGEPISVLIDESDNAQLLVMGSTGAGGFAGMLLGSNAVALVARGHCPVAVIRGHTEDEALPTEGPVVVGVDGSSASELALAAAFDEASWRGAELVAVHTWTEYVSDGAYARARQFFVDWDAVATGERELLAERLAGWQEKYPDVTARRVVDRETPARCLLAQAAHAQLIVVGSRGHGEIAGKLLGSTSQALIYHATCPVLVVRPS